MADYGCIAITTCHFDSIESFGKCSYLVNLYQHAISAIQFNTFAKVFDIGYKKVITHKLATVADALGEHSPSFPVILAHAVFY